MATIFDNLKTIYDGAIALANEHQSDALRLVGLAGQFNAAKTAHDKALVVVEIAKLVTAKTDTPVDDDFVEAVEALLRCPEFKAAADKFMAHFVTAA